MQSQALTLRQPCSRRALGHPSTGIKSERAFTVVEAMAALAVLMIFAVSTTVTLNLFNDRAAKNRNTEAARALVDDYVNHLLSDNVTLTTATTDSGITDDGGNQLGAVCKQIGTRYIPDGSTAATANGVVPLIVARNAAANAIVSGVLYWRVQPVGNAYSLNKDTDLMQVQFTLAYVYRSKTYYFQALTFKANNT